MLFTLGGLGVWFFIDLIRLAFGKFKDKKGNELVGKNKVLSIVLGIIGGLYFLMTWIGIVSAIAIPQYNEYHRDAQDAAAQSAYHAISLAEEAYNAETGVYTDDYYQLRDVAGLTFDSNIRYHPIELFKACFTFSVNYNADKTTVYEYNSCRDYNVTEQRGAGVKVANPLPPAPKAAATAPAGSQAATSPPAGSQQAAPPQADSQPAATPPPATSQAPSKASMDELAVNAYNKVALAEEIYFSQNFVYTDDFNVLRNVDTDIDIPDKNILYSGIKLFFSDNGMPCYAFAVKYDDEDATIYDYNSCGTPVAQPRGISVSGASASSSSAEDAVRLSANQIAMAEDVYFAEHSLFTNNYETLENLGGLKLDTDIQYSEITVFENQDGISCFAFALKHKSEGSSIFDYNSCAQPNLKKR
jgi:Tfp pilus assembly protein PilE